MDHIEEHLMEARIEENLASREICTCGHIQGIHDLGEGACNFWQSGIGRVSCACDTFHAEGGAK